jgi:uncharacterized protein
MDLRLLELMVCPICKGPLEHRCPPWHDQQELVCHADRLAFPVRDGKAIMLEAEARTIDAQSGSGPAA